MAVRSGRYKVVWRSQLFVGKKEDEPTSKTFCAGTGNCCVDTPTRLCNCQWATNYDPPIVIDLITNPSEDPTAAITNPEVLLAATKIRDDRVRDVMIARGFPFEGLTTEEQLDYLLAGATQPHIGRLLRGSSRTSHYSPSRPAGLPRRCV